MSLLFILHGWLPSGQTSYAYSYKTCRNNKAENMKLLPTMIKERICDGSSSSLSTYFCVVFILKGHLFYMFKKVMLTNKYEKRGNQRLRAKRNKQMS